MIFSKENVFKPNSNSEFEEGNKKTIIGWIQHLYLWTEDENGYIDIKSGWRNKYEKAELKLREIAGLTKSENLLEWEERISANKAAILLNKLNKVINE